MSPASVEHFNWEQTWRIRSTSQSGSLTFPYPGFMKEAAIEAIRTDLNGYTLTTGHPQLLEAISTHLEKNINWNCDSDELDLMITSGTSGALLLSFMAMLNPGDEAVIADPYFVVYPTLGPMTGASIVYCDTYPDFRMTAEHVSSPALPTEPSSSS